MKANRSAEKARESVLVKCVPVKEKDQVGKGFRKVITKVHVIRIAFETSFNTPHNVVASILHLQ